MSIFLKRGEEIRSSAKELVLDLMTSSAICQPDGAGMKQAEIFRECGLDYGDYPSATSSNQQYWVVAILRELEAENKIERVSSSGPWRLR
ncbi:MAG: hypothetical protein HC840_28015 [Leptolyngbyaceae cyanobacterium RM2_2_4]|nr:hypothetical protein [Leptolyngbyaceae cyanobacterium RM2_2_4]